MLKFGVQTIIWGEPLASLVTCLRVIRESGYEGVEFAQTPRFLSGYPGSKEQSAVANELREELERNKLTLLGFSGGSLEQRVKFCEDFGFHPKYFYIEKWHSSFKTYLDRGFSLALHPHVFKEIHGFQDALRILKEESRLKFLPDIAHLSIAGANILEVLESTKGKLAAVHMKDWTRVYGRSRLTYARGFTALGQGDLTKELEQAYSWLKENFNNGWLVVEQDHTETTPKESLSVSRKWLDGPITLNSAIESEEPLSVEGSHSSACCSERISQALQSIYISTTKRTDFFYKTILAECLSLTGGQSASVWELNAQSDIMTLAAFSGNHEYPPEKHVLLASDTLCELAAREREIMVFRDLKRMCKENKFLDKSFVEKNDIYMMLSIPVKNIYNFNSVEMMINIFFNTGSAIQTKLYHLYLLAQHFAIGLNLRWSMDRLDTLSAFAVRVDMSEELEGYLASQLCRIAKKLDAKSVVTYMPDQSESKLKIAARSDLSNDDNTTFGVSNRVNWPEELELESDNPAVASCWRAREELIANVGTHSGELDVLSKQLECYCTSCLAVPLHKTDRWGDILGIIACVKTDGERPFFSTHDEIILDAIQTALAPAIERLLIVRARTRFLRILRHELREPVSCITNVVQDIQEDRKLYKLEAMKFIKEFNQKLREQMCFDFLSHDDVLWMPAHNYFNDINEYARLVQHVIEGVGVLSSRGKIKLNTSRTLIYDDILKPAMGYIELFVDKRAKQIVYDASQHLPIMYLDRALFMQCVLNILRNAVKYNVPDETSLHIEVTAQGKPNQDCVLFFRDYGIGVEKGLEEKIFREEYRGKQALTLDAKGDGYGLYLARRIVEAHGGSLTLSNNCKPTEFKLTLPRPLQDFHGE